MVFFSYGLHLPLSSKRLPLSYLLLITYTLASYSTPSPPSQYMLLAIFRVGEIGGSLTGFFLRFIGFPN